VNGVDLTDSALVETRFEYASVKVLLSLLTERKFAIEARTKMSDTEDERDERK
jgi:hypothetical protein